MSGISKIANEDTNSPTLLAVDLGLKMGLARFTRNGRLLHYRSHNLGSVSRLRRAAPRILAVSDAWLFAEGDRRLFEVWQRVAERRGVSTQLVPAETWRSGLLLSRQRRDGRTAKHVADQLARRVIDWSAAPKPTSLRHDAAEAILLGMWAVLEVGWLDRLPHAVRPGR